MSRKLIVLGFNALASDVVYLYGDLLEDNPVNAGARLTQFLAGCSGKKVIFPYNKTYTLETYVSLSGISNIEIDFNGCTLIPQDNASATGFSDGYGVLTVMNHSAGVTINNLIVNGNRIGNAGHSFMGVRLEYCTNVVFNHYQISEVEDHGVWISDDTHNIHFYYGTYRDNHHIGSKLGSDIYVANNADCDVSFHTVDIDRTTFTGNQACYIAGYNTLIENLTAHNIDGAILDYRRGTHVARNIVSDYCGMLMVAQGSTVDLDLQHAQCTNITHESVASATEIAMCSRIYMDDISLSWSALAPFPWHGLRIDRQGDPGTIDNVSVSNITIAGYRRTGVRFETLDRTCTIDTVDLTPTGATSYDAAAVDTTEIQHFHNATLHGVSLGIQDPDGVID